MQRCVEHSCDGKSPDGVWGGVAEGSDAHGRHAADDEVNVHSERTRTRVGKPMQRPVPSIQWRYVLNMFFQVRMSVVRRDVDICSQFQQNDLEHRELRLESQLGAIRDFAVDQRGRQQGQRSPVLSQFLTAAEASGQGRTPSRSGVSTEGGQLQGSRDDEDYEVGRDEAVDDDEEDEEDEDEDDDDSASDL